MKIILIWIILTVISWFIITTIVNWILLGIAIPKYSRRCALSKFMIEKKNRVDIQQNVECSAFSSAYVMRHWGVEANGEELYKVIPNKMKDGYVYPKGILHLLPQYGFKVKYYIGNLNALKNEVSKGNPVIVMIKIDKDRRWLHYVPVVGYDEDNIYIAESLDYLVNCKEGHYNRKVEISEFKKLWNTSMLKMPLYKNTYIAIEKIK